MSRNIRNRLPAINVNLNIWANATKNLTYTELSISTSSTPLKSALLNVPLRSIDRPQWFNFKVIPSNVKTVDENTWSTVFYLPVEYRNFLAAKRRFKLSGICHCIYWYQAIMHIQKYAPTKILALINCITHIEIFKTLKTY